MKLHIKNGRVIDPVSGMDAVQDIYVEAGKILAITPPEISVQGFNSDRVIDASGMVVTPGLVDLSARLREPGYEYKATLESEMYAAACGGVTSLICPPDTDPVLDEPGLVEMLKHRAKNLNLANVYPLGALTIGLMGENITEMAELTEAGCIGFSQAMQPISDTTVLMRAMQYAKTYDYRVWLRPENPCLGKGVAHSGAVALRLGLSGIPVISETIALHTIFELMRHTGASVHLCRISSAAGLALVKEAKAEGLPVTCDVCAYNIHMTENDIGFFNPNMRMLPPFRTENDRQAIGKALLDGTIDAICSDHTPVDDDEKLLPFAEASPGATGLELLLPLALKWAEEYIDDEQARIASAVALISSHAAKIAKLPCGELKQGEVADLCIFDPQATWLVQSSALASQGKNTPFMGQEVKGQVNVTVVSGQIAYERR